MGVFVTNALRVTADNLYEMIDRVIDVVAADGAPEAEVAAARELLRRGVAGLYEAADIIGQHRGEPPRTDAIKRK